MPSIQNQSQNAIPYTVTLDDDPVICSLIQEMTGLKTFSFAGASDLLKNLDALEPTGVFVDVHLAGNECGLDIIPELRKAWPCAPVIVITGDSQDQLISQALAAGAQDFVLKPFRQAEVLARLNARRDELLSHNHSDIVQFGDLVIDVRHRSISGPKGKSFQSPREIDLLTFLIRAAGTVVEKEALKRHVWGSVKVSANALDRKLFEIRKAIRGVTDQVEMKAIYGKGICLRSVTHDEDKILLEDKELALSRQIPH